MHRKPSQYTATPQSDHTRYLHDRYSNMGLARSPQGPSSQSPRPSPGFSRTHGCIALGACGMMGCCISFGWRSLSVRLCLSVFFSLYLISFFLFPLVHDMAGPYI
ncbi:hypothetical protein J3E68DRAFT_389571 [Trichoderma sp. SZMC 28012]